MRVALLFTISGLIVEAFCIYDVTPGTFVVFAAVAAPLVTVGVLLFVRTVWRALRRSGGL
jgi:hypothetical protein